MQEAFTYVEKEYGRDRARVLFKKNPLMLLKN
jgi:protein-tyrosine phosphatase